MIKTWTCSDTEQLFIKGYNRRWKNIARVALRRLNMLNAADSLQTLAKIPGNRLELLKDDRQGQHSIRINDQWRICFAWKDGNAYDVEITDYH